MSTNFNLNSVTPEKRKKPKPKGRANASLSQTALTIVGTVQARKGLNRSNAIELIIREWAEVNQEMLDAVSEHQLVLRGV